MQSGELEENAPGPFQTLIMAWNLTAIEAAGLKNQARILCQQEIRTRTAYDRATLGYQRTMRRIGGCFTCPLNSSASEHGFTRAAEPKKPLRVSREVAAQNTQQQLHHVTWLPSPDHPEACALVSPPHLCQGQAPLPLACHSRDLL